MVYIMETANLPWKNKLSRAAIWVDPAHSVPTSSSYDDHSCPPAPPVQPNLNLAHLGLACCKSASSVSRGRQLTHSLASCHNESQIVRYTVTLRFSLDGSQIMNILFRYFFAHFRIIIFSISEVSFGFCEVKGLSKRSLSKRLKHDNLNLIYQRGKLYWVVRIFKYNTTRWRLHKDCK